MKFYARLYKQSKGPKVQSAYIAILSKGTVNKIGVKDGSPLMLETNGESFVSVIRKMAKRKDRVQLGFTVPFRIGKKLKNKQTYKFKLLGLSLKRDFNKKSAHINLQRIAPKKTIRGYPIHIFDSMDGKILFWIYSKGNKTYSLPKHVPLEIGNYSLMELFGAFMCEGFKSRIKGKHRDRLSFSSMDKENIKWFVACMNKLLNIKKTSWKCQILLPKGNDNEAVKNYWSSTGISYENISIVKNNKISAKNGVCILNIFGSTLSEIFQHLMDYCIDIALKNKENSIKVFRGFSRGDLGVSGRTISFSTDTQENAILFKKICKNMKITTSRIYRIHGKKGYWSVFITGRWNFERLLRDKCLTHRKRKATLIKALLNNKKFTLYKYLKSVKNGHNTSKKTSKFLNLSQIATRIYLAKHENEGHLKSVINKRFYNQKVYSLSEKGEREYSFLNNLEKQTGD